MDPNVKQFLLINGAIVALVVAYMVLGRSKPRQPSRLKLRNESEKIEVTDEEKILEMKGHTRDPRKPKELNIIFQFNGHDFEAYEVLGLPAGSSLEKVEEAYKKAKSELPEGELELLEMAYRSILKN